MNENFNSFQISQKQLFEACKINGLISDAYNVLNEPEI